MRKSFRNSSVMLLAGLFTAGLQACTKAELVIPDASAPKPQASGRDVVSKRSFRSTTTNESFSYLSLVLAKSPILWPAAASTPRKAGDNPDMTTDLLDGEGGSGCYEIVDVYYDLNTGEYLGEQIVGYEGNCSGGGTGGSPTNTTPPPPSGGTSGGGSSSSTPRPGNPDPCQTNAVLAANEVHNGLAKSLIDRVKLDYETGFAYGTFNGGIRAQEIASAPGTDDLVVQLPRTDIQEVPVKLDVLMHTHTPGLLPIFSLSDLKTIASLYHEGAFSSATTFTAELFTAAGTAYSLTISNTQQLVEFDDVMKQGGVRMNNTYEAFYQNYGISASSSAAQNELGLAKMLATLKIGLELSKPDPSRPGKAIRLSVDSNGGLVATPCN